MTPKRVVLARHGETVFNRERVLMGRADSPLTPEGRELARATATVLQRESVDAVYCSPLGRARATARIYIEGMRVPIILQDGMAELACGEWEGIPRQAVKPGRGPIRSSWNDAPPGGESYHEAEPRIAAVIRELLGPKAPKRVLVVGHAGVNRVFLKLWLGLEPEEAVRIRCPHDVLYILDGPGTVVARSSTGEEGRSLLYEP